MFCQFYVIDTGLGGAATIKHYVFECMPCRNLKAVPGAQVMSPLPDLRSKPGRRAFYACRVDLFGNFFVRVGRGSAKRCGCIFTCLASRAVHLELVECLSTDAFWEHFFVFCVQKVFLSNMYFLIRALTFMVQCRNYRGVKKKLLMGCVYCVKLPALVLNGILERQLRHTLAESVKD